MTFPLMSAGLVRAHPARAGRVGGDALLHQQPGRRRGRARERLRADRLGRAARHAAHRGRAEPRCSPLVVWLLARPARHAPFESDVGRGNRARACCSPSRSSPASPRSSTRSAGSACSSLVLGASTHSFELMLATFILGPRARRPRGAPRASTRAPDPVRLLAWVQVAMGLAALATLPVYDFTFSLMEALLKGLARTETGYLLFNLSGAGDRRAGDAAGDFLRRHDAAAHHRARCCAAARARRRSARCTPPTRSARSPACCSRCTLGLPLLGLKGTLIAGALVDVALGLRSAQDFANRTAWRFAAAACARAVRSRSASASSSTRTR